MIAALELDRRLERAGRRRGVPRRQRPDRDRRAIAVVRARDRRRAERRRGSGCRCCSARRRRAAGSSGSTAARPTASWARTSRPCRAACRAAGSPWRRSLDVLSDRVLWRMVAMLATKPLLIAGAVRRGARAAGAARGDPQPRRAGRRRPRRRSTTSGRGRSAPGLGLVLLALRRRPPRCWRSRRSTRSTRCCARSGARCWPRAPRRTGRCARCWPRAWATARWRSPTGCPIARPSSTRRASPSRCPQPGSGRAWTAVERDGRRVAAIVHDAALDTSRELVHAAAAASSLAIDNERLKADLRARVEELRVSRLRIVEAADEARRRIERDLHDGAQQQLVALALELRVLRSSHQRPGGRAAGRRARRAAGRRAGRAARARARHPSGDPHRRSGLEPADRRAGGARAGPGARRRARSMAGSPRRSRRPRTSSWPRR